MPPNPAIRTPAIGPEETFSAAQRCSERVCNSTVEATLADRRQAADYNGRPTVASPSVAREAVRRENLSAWIRIVMANTSLQREGPI
jgi:hypothetical protein